MIVVVADDVSGATELATIAVDRGLSAEVQTRFEPTTGVDVVAVSTESRSLSRAAAAAQTSEAARRVVRANPAWIYKKVDSVLRGHVAAELQAVMRAAGCARALLVPANPSKRRVVRDGHYFIDDVLLAETSFAQDPDFPARSSRVLDLLGETDRPGIEIPDVVEAADIEAVCQSLGPSTLPAGAADFFAALLETRGVVPPSGDRRVVPSRPDLALGTSLFVCGSAVAWPTRRREFAAKGIRIATFPEELWERLASPAGIRRWARTLADDLAAGSCLLAAIGERADPLEVPTSTLVTRLAEAVVAALENVKVNRLFLEGGATASAVLRQLGCTRLRVERHAPGLAALTPTAADGVTIHIKPGSYPWPAEVFG